MSMKRFPLLLFGALTVTGLAVWAQTQSSPAKLDFRMPETQQKTHVPMVAPDVSANGFLTPLAMFHNPFQNQAPIMRAEGDGEGDEKELPRIYGSVIGASNYQTQRGYNIIPLGPDQKFTFVNYAGQSMTAGTESDGVVYVNNIVERYGGPYCASYYMYDIKNNWQQLGSQYQSSDFLGAARDMATDPTTGEIYGCFVKTHACVSFVLATCEYTSSGYNNVQVNRHTIADLDNMLTAIFFTADGQLWGIDLVTGPDDAGEDQCQSASLYKIDKKTGAMTLVGDTGAKPYYASSAACDIYGDGTVYWSVKEKSNVGSLYTVDLTTGKATKVMDFPNNEEVVGMFVPMRANPKAPKAPEKLDVDFPNGGLTGTLSLTVPAELADGTPGEGKCKVEFFIDGNSIGSIDAPYGETVSGKVTLENSAQYTFSARLSNDAGKSELVKTQYFVGMGQPEAPEPVLAVRNNKAYLVWEPITKAYGDRGYVDPEKITYTVFDKDGVEVVAGYKNTQLVIPLESDEFQMLVYEVRADAGENSYSSRGRSNVVATGEYKPGFVETFDNPYLMNNDGSPWLDIQVDGATLGHWYVHNGEKAACASTGFGQEDSWLISPAIRLEAGKTYFLGFDTWGNFDSKITKYEVKLGPAQSYLAMNQEIVPMTEQKNKKATARYEGATFTVPSNGVYYLGIHCYTPNGGPSLFVDNLTIEEKQANVAPGKVSDFTASPTAKNTTSIHVKLTAPATDRYGAAMTDPMTINIEREGNIVKTQTGVAPGATIEFDEEMSKGGDVVYTAWASNEYGDGAKSTTTATNVGYKGGRAPSKVTLAFNEDRNFLLTWEPDMRDQGWTKLTDTDVTFAVVGVRNGETYIVEDNIPGSERSLVIENTNKDGEQAFVQYGVAMFTNGGTMGVAASNAVANGKAYATPYKESFSGKAAGILATMNISGSPEWGIYDDKALQGITSADGDNGFAGMFAQYQNQEGGLLTGIIDLAGLETPGISLKVFNLTSGVGNTNEISIKVVTESGETKAVRAYSDRIGSLGMPNEWVKYVVSLEEFKGQKVQILIDCKVVNYIATFIDDIEIGNLAGHDLTALQMIVPETIEVGKKGDFTVGFLNNGYYSCDYTVELLRDNKVVASEEFTNLKAGEFATQVILDAPDVNANEQSMYAVRVVTEDDADLDDNMLGPVPVNVILPAYPTIKDLAADNAEAGVALTWTEPDKEYVPNPTRESFETAEAWSQAAEGWTFVDVDEAPISLGSADGLFGDLHNGDKLGFFVVDADPSKSLGAHVGDRLLMKAAPGGSEIGDDWIISPELIGTEQTVSLWARTYSAQTPENIEVLWSEGSVDPVDFTSAARYFDLPVQWTNITAKLPAGAKRLALRSRSAGTFFMLLDDVSFTETPKDLQLVGYNVYRDGLLITETPVATAAYTDPEGEPGMKYRVSAVYNEGESVPGNEAYAEDSGINGIGNGGIVIGATRGKIVVSYAEGQTIEVVAADGRIVATEAGKALNVIPVDGGVYIVKVGKRVAKVVVK